MEQDSPVGVSKFFVDAQCFFEMFQPPGAFALPTYKLAQTQMEIGEKLPVSPKLFNQLEGRAPTRNCLLMCKDTPCFVARSTQVIDGLFCVPGLAKVIRQCGKLRRQVRRMDLFQRFGNPAMESTARRIGRVFVKSLADQRMREAKALT